MKSTVLIISIFFITAFFQQSFAQGCVAIRSNGNTCSIEKPGGNNGWLLNLNHRYYKSYKHFVGTIEQKQREEEGTEVINHSHSFDITITKLLNARWSLALDIPVLSNVRSSLYEHGGNSAGPVARHSTRSFGLGDIRFTAYRWMFDPVSSHNGNLQFGLGLKLPTGDFKFQDHFYKNDTTKILGPVDQSIQLGDGGTGITIETNAYYNFSYQFGVYANAYYLINPREHNGTSNARGSMPSSTAIRYGTEVMSTPDQFMVRGGINYFINHLTFSGGIRMECLPAKDLIGGNLGFRRPGYVISAEPAVSFMLKKITAYCSVPVALIRNRTQSVSDKLRSKDTGTHIQGDAAFANFLVNVGCTIRL